MGVLGKTHRSITGNFVGRTVTVLAGLVRAYFVAPVGIAMPGIAALLFYFVPQMPGMLVGTADGYTDTASGLPGYDDAPWHQIGLPLGILLLSFQCWFWTRAALNAAAGRYDGERRRLPAEEALASRLLLIATLVLGLGPLWVAKPGSSTSWWHMRWHDLAQLDVPWAGIAVALVCWLALFAFIVLRRRVPRFRSAVPDSLMLPQPLTERLFAAAPYGPRFAWTMLGIPILLVLLGEFAPEFVERNLHTASAAMLGMSCYVALASVWLTLMRDLCRWLLQRVAALPYGASVQYASWIGLALYVATPLLGLKAAENLSLYPIATQPDDGAWRHYAESFVVPNDCKRPIIVSAAGGASRAAAWELTVLRAIDLATDGKASHCLSAISGVSGGSLGAVTYALARSRPGATNDHLRDAAVALARYDMLPAVAFRLFSVDLLFGLPSRGPALARAYEDYWRYWSGLGLEAPSFKDAFPAHPGPILALNGVDVRTGSRLITTNLIFPDGDRLSNIVDGRDVFGHIGSAMFSAADAVLNSARFPVMSPPGLIGNGSRNPWAVVDGGLYEASGVATALELRTMLIKNGADPILIVISNEGASWANPSPDQASTAPARERDTYGPCSISATEAASLKRTAVTATGQLPVPELLTSLDALNQTRSTRYLAELARARAQFCGSDAASLRLFVFELPAPPADSNRAPVPMNWALGARDCEFMLGDGISWAPNLHNLDALATLFDQPPPASLRTRFHADAATCRARTPDR